MKSANFEYKKICSNLIKGLPDRVSDVLVRRFGLKSGNKETLEAIGQSYDITRERVRQIEEEGFSKVKPKIKEYQEVFDYFADYLKPFGGVKKEDVLLSSLGGKKYQSHVYFLLTLAQDFERHFEDKDFYSFWAKGKESVDSAKKVVALAVDKLKEHKKPVTLDELLKIQKNELSKVCGAKECFNSYIEISKNIQGNPDGQIGLADWVEINPRGIKDKAYLVIKKAGKSLHFTDVAKMIENLAFFSQKKVHTATVHNELIKDSRFVLVGRGLYGLKEWGYEPGVVREIIAKVLKEAKTPLAKDEIVEKVLKQRMVKENTVFLNLQNKNYFVKDSTGKYAVKEA